jgi:predicted short-subunit dehydrogenase-like oxidoreductase (DUF2520 family)
LKKKLHNIVLVGAGNVATHMSKAFRDQGYRIVQVYSRTLESARILASQLDTTFITNINRLDYTSDLYLFCLKDDALMPVLSETRFTTQLLVHTSGTLPLNIFQEYSKNYGVLYPVQTFSKTRRMDMSDVPFCIEASNPDAALVLENLISEISKNIIYMDSEKRKFLHLAAVFACNFPNHMYHLAKKILWLKDLSFDLLKPLILETAGKILETDPKDAQTGPAVRGDQKILEEHLHLLKNLPEIQKMYTFVSNSISAHKEIPE